MFHHFRLLADYNLPRYHLYIPVLVHSFQIYQEMYIVHHLHRRLHDEAVVLAVAGAGVPAHAEVERERRLTTAHHRGLRRGATHVERQHVVLAEQPAHEARGHHARRTTRLDRGDRLAGRERRRQHTTARLHDLHRAHHADAAQHRLQPVEVRRHHRADVGARERRGGALVLAHLGPRVGGGHDEHTGHSRAARGRELLLVGRVRVGVQEADRDRSAVREGRALQR